MTGREERGGDQELLSFSLSYQNPFSVWFLCFSFTNISSNCIHLLTHPLHHILIITSKFSSHYLSASMVRRHLKRCEIREGKNLREILGKKWKVRRRLRVKEISGQRETSNDREERQFWLRGDFRSGREIRANRHQYRVCAAQITMICIVALTKLVLHDQYTF